MYRFYYSLLIFYFVCTNVYKIWLALLDLDLKMDVPGAQAIKKSCFPNTLY